MNSLAILSSTTHYYSASSLERNGEEEAIILISNKMRWYAASSVCALVATISVASVHSFSISSQHNVVVDYVSSSSIASHCYQQQLYSRIGDRRIIHYFSSRRDVKLYGKLTEEDEAIIDAIVEGKTAGLALNDEENTTVSISVLL